MGEPCEEHLEFDRTQFDHRRVFVSDPSVAGKRIRELGLSRNFGAIITRVKRGDMEWLPDGDLRLELGDRVRILTHRKNVRAVSAFFGDSYKSLSQIDILAFGLGLALGLVLGSIPIPLPGGFTVKLGFAGGPLVVALTLGTVIRSGSIVWSLPYSANLTLRQLGLVLFLAGIGTRSGYAFVSTLAQGNGLVIFAAGAAITCIVTLAALLVGKLVLKTPMGMLIGMLAGMQTQPAVLGFALEQTGDESPNIGYATVYPVAMIAKILLAQLVLSVLQ
jgi:putative transport protein